MRIKKLLCTAFVLLLLTACGRGGTPEQTTASSQDIATMTEQGEIIEEN